MKFSIIVPVYNAEEFLRSCVDSVLGQIYPDFELILVNDGSSDNSRAIIDEYALADTRIKVIHQVNQGVSNARNAGLDIMSGDWALFLDADDALHQSTLSRISEEIRKDDELDVIQFGISRELFQEGALENGDIYISPCSPEDYLKIDNYNVCAGGTAFNLRLNSLHNFRFDESMKLAEDQVFILYLVSSSRKCCKIPDKMYYYRQNQSSVTNSHNPHSMIDSIRAFESHKKINPLAVKQLDYMTMLFLYNLAIDYTLSAQYVADLINNVSVKRQKKYIRGPKMLFYISRVSALLAVVFLRFFYAKRSKN